MKKYTQQIWSVRIISVLFIIFVHAKLYELLRMFVVRTLYVRENVLVTCKRILRFVNILCVYFTRVNIIIRVFGF